MNGIVELRSNHSVDHTIERLKAMLEAKGVTVFAVIDHAGEAARVGMQMPSTKLVIFGNPKAGTTVMLAAPSSALDLPLKILVHQDGAGIVWVSYNTAAYLAERHGVPDAQRAPLDAVAALAEHAAAR